jgi:alkanesulfonate monooxygenase SsuD/methylene tetrahydromethanopterin reductase-like flavin-dependent oxidoreductase (luciferase family)
MRLGLFIAAQYESGSEVDRRIEEHLEQVSFARDHDFATVLVGQHFLPEPYGMLQPVPLLARLAAEAGPSMQLGTGILLLPLLNPLEVAEEVATLDHLCGGRFVLGVGMGYRTEEFEAFAVPPRRVAIFREKLDVVRRLLVGEEVTASGHGYRLEGARLTLRPRRLPPIWMAANNDGAVRRAAELADTWLVNPHTLIGELQRQVELFRRERGQPLNVLPLMREVCLAPTRADAEGIARRYLAQKYDAYVEWGQSDVLPEGDTLRRDWDDLLAGRFIIGDPESAAEQLREYRDRLGMTELVARVQWPGLPHETAMRSLRLLATEVLPRV